MSSEGHHGPSWFKIFAMILAVLLTMFLLLLIKCDWSLMDATSAFNTFLCVTYLAFGALCLLLSFPVCLVGIEHAKRHHKPFRYYLFMLAYVVAASIAFVYTKFF